MPGTEGRAAQRDVTRDLGGISETVTHRDVTTHHVPAGWHPVFLLLLPKLAVLGERGIPRGARLGGKLYHL